jgi:hypothetical protein
MMDKVPARKEIGKNINSMEEGLDRPVHEWKERLPDLAPFLG